VYLKEDVEVVLGEGQATEVLVVHVQHIAALFKSLQWAYKQNYFPFMQVPRPMHQSIYIYSIRCSRACSGPTSRTTSPSCRYLGL
jgi:hypothetical protein